MVLFFNSNGDLIKTSPQAIYQGSSDAGQVYIVAPFSQKMVVSVAFKLPDGSYTQPYICANAGTVDIDGVDGLSVWYVSLDSTITQFYGNVTLQALFYVQGCYFEYKGTVSTVSNLPTDNAVIGWVYYVEGTKSNYTYTGTAWEEMTGDAYAQKKIPVLASQSVTITVNKGVAPVVDTEPSADIWQQILAALSSYAQNTPKISTIEQIKSINITVDEDGIKHTHTLKFTDTDGREYAVPVTYVLPLVAGQDLEFKADEMDASKPVTVEFTREFVAYDDDIIIDGGHIGEEI